MKNNNDTIRIKIRFTLLRTWSIIVRIILNYIRSIEHCAFVYIFRYGKNIYHFAKRARDDDDAMVIVIIIKIPGRYIIFYKLYRYRYTRIFLFPCTPHDQLLRFARRRKQYSESRENVSENMSSLVGRIVKHKGHPALHPLLSSHSR